MKFCVQKSFGPPGKHPRFQQGRKGHKAKGHKAIKARVKIFPKFFLSIFEMCVCVLHQLLRVEVPIITEAI